MSETKLVLGENVENVEVRTEDAKAVYRDMLKNDVLTEVSHSFSWNNSASVNLFTSNRSVHSSDDGQVMTVPVLTGVEISFNRGMVNPEDVEPGTPIRDEIDEIIQKHNFDDATMTVETYQNKTYLSVLVGNDPKDAQNSLLVATPN